MTEHVVRNRLLLVDDHRYIIDSMKLCFRSLDLFNGFDGATSLAEALERLALRNDYGLIVVDLGLADADGLDALSAIDRLHPDIPKLVFSANESVDVMEAAFRCGASGFVSKQQSIETLLVAVRNLLAGQRHIPEALLCKFGLPAAPRTVTNGTRGSISGFRHAARVDLNDRQIKMLRMLANAACQKTIAKEFDIAVGTVKTHLDRIYKTLGVNKAIEAVNRARELGLL